MDRRRIFLMPLGGLANRLMGLVSTMRLAELSGRDLMMNWEKTYVMNCPPEELFANPPPPWDRDLTYIPPEHRTMIDAFTIGNGSASPVLDLSAFDGDINLLSNCLLAGPQDDRGTDFWNWTKTALDFGVWFEKLGLSLAVRDFVDQVTKHHDLGSALGLHIRRGPLDKVDEAAYFNTLTEDDYFKVIEALAPGERVFLATDSAEVRERFAAVLGDRLIPYEPRSLQRDEDPRAIQDALVEIVLLSKCRLLAGIAWSTFAYVASLIRGIPYVQVQPAVAPHPLAMTTNTYRSTSGEFEHASRFFHVAAFSSEERDLLYALSPKEKPRMTIAERQSTEERGWFVEPLFTGDPLIPRSLLDELEEHPEAPGRSAWGTRNILASYILSMRPKSVLEIGAHIGSASVVMGAALKRNNFGTLYTLEPAQHYFDILKSFINKAGVEDFVQPLQMMSTDPALLQTLPRQVEIIYLDANHSYSHAVADLELCDKLLPVDGIVFLDDTGYPKSAEMDSEKRGGVRQAVVDFAKDRPDLQVVFLEYPFWLNPCGMGMIVKQRIVR